MLQTPQITYFDSDVSTTSLKSNIFLTTQDKYHEKVEFDDVLLNLWNEANARGACRYKLKLMCKRLPGLFKFVVQMNSQRSQNRRTPEAFAHVSMPFNKDKFNFTKVLPSEILFKIQRVSPTQDLTLIEKAGNSDDVALINASPFAIGMLLVPKLSACKPQILDAYAVKLALEVHCWSQNVNFLTIFNGMCAQASVNHLHLHCYYLNIRENETAVLEDENNSTPAGVLIQQSLPARNKISQRCFICDETPLPSFLFEVACFTEISPVAEDVATIVEYLVERKVPHNMTIVRAPPIRMKFENDSCLDEKPSVIRIYLWPRALIVGKKTNDVNIGVTELSGHVLVPEDCYDSITETELLEKFRCVALLPGVFEEIVNDIRLKLNQNLSI